jgi:hypothetical protein
MSIDNYNKQVVNPLIEILSEKRISMWVLDQVTKQSIVVWVEPFPVSNSTPIMWFDMDRLYDLLKKVTRPYLHDELREVLLSDEYEYMKLDNH